MDWKLQKFIFEMTSHSTDILESIFYYQINEEIVKILLVLFQQLSGPFIFLSAVSYNIFGLKHCSN